jgi:cyclophilin family peptidyl-prolyl cis-trans isomerase
MSKNASNDKEEEVGCVDTSMISIVSSSSSSASVSFSSNSSNASSSSNAVDLLDAEETSLSYDDSDSEDVAFLFGTPSSSYDALLVKPSKLSSSSSKASMGPIVAAATKRSAGFVATHPILMAALVFGASFAAGGMLARKHLLSQLVKVRTQHQTLLVARAQLLASHPQLDKVPAGTTGLATANGPAAIAKTTADETRELQDQLDVLQAELHAKKFELERVTEDRTAREQEMLDAIDKLGPIVSGSHHKMVMMQNRRRTATASASATASTGVMLDQDEGSFQHKEAIAHLVKTMAYDQFGPEIHDVEFRVRYYPDDHKEDGGKTTGEEPDAAQADAAAEKAGPVEGRFVVEVADFENNPLSSFLFLQQVDHGLWDDTSFHVNAPHMLLAQPASARVTANSTTTTTSNAPASRLPEMQALGLSRLPIMEYSDAWGQHEKYTIGFGGATATAGSFFYLNKMDNAKTHDGQACFAQVVEGTQVVDAIFSLANYDANFRLRRPVEIVSVRIVDYDVAEEVDEEKGRHHHDLDEPSHRHPHQANHVVHRRGSRRDRDEDAHHHHPRQHHDHHHKRGDEEPHDEGEHTKEQAEIVADH